MEKEVPRRRRKKQVRASQDDVSSTTSKESSTTQHSHQSAANTDNVNYLPLKDKRALFQEKVRQSNEACQSGDFVHAIQLYSEALVLDPANHILYSNRSAAHVKLKEYEKALQDAVQAKELNPKWSKAYYRQGVALQCLGRHADSLAAFSSGLAQDPKSLQLQGGLVEAALKSPLKDTFEPIYKQLQSMKLDKSPFVIISVIGQELLAAGYHASSLVVLESALKIGTCSLKLRGSVFSALSSAHWGLGNTEKAISFMHQDLAVAKSLGDQVGECRAHGNLGAAYFSNGNYKEALTHHRFQLVLAMKQKDRTVAASALSSLGHVYSAVGDYPNALASHKQCVLLAKQLNDKQFEAREVGNVGAVFLALGESDQALECHKEHLKIAKDLDNKNEEARAYSNLGSAFHYKRDFDKAMEYHSEVLHISQDLKDRAIEARACAGLGHAARCNGNLDKAKGFHEQQLNIALSMKDKVTEGRACSNLGIIYQQKGQYDMALKLHKAHLTIASEIKDKAAQGRAYGNMGNAFSSLGQYDQAVKYHKQELVISREVNDRVAEASTQGNLAVAYQAMNMHDKAMEHYRGHMNISKELNDKSSLSRAYRNLGNYHSSRGEFSQALPIYGRYLAICEELGDKEGLGNAFHNLGYAHYSLGHYKEAVEFYEKDLLLARDQKNKISMGRAYCNLGLAYRTLGNYQRAEECQKCFLSIAHQVKNIPGKFRALGNLGDVFMAKQDTQGAIRFYEQQLQLAKQAENKSLEASAFGSLGASHRKLKQCDKALGFHTQELQLYQELNDFKGECKAHSHLGAVHTSLGKYLDAFKCYEEQLDRAKELRDSILQAQACGNLGISKMNMGLYEDALGFFEEQLATLEQCIGSTVMHDRGRAYEHLAECYESLGDYEDAIRNFELYLSVAQRTHNSAEQDRAYQGLGNVQKNVGNLQQALFCFEKRLLMAHETENLLAKGSAYGELGRIHSLMGNFEQAISCMEHHLRISKEMKDKTAQADAACGLGEVYLHMGDFQRALEFHQLNLTIAEETNNLAGQGRAFGNLGTTHESIGDFQKAIMYQEQHLSIAAQLNDKIAKSQAYSSLGRVHHSLGNYTQSIAYLRQGLQISEQVSRREDEAKIRYSLGLSFWSNENLEEAQHQLYRAIDLFEQISRDIHLGTEYQMSMFDAQTATYQTLQRILISSGKPNEALMVAERGKNKAFVDLLLERQSKDEEETEALDTTSMLDIEQIQDVVKRLGADVLYYSIAGGHLHCWRLSPNEGIAQFCDTDLSKTDMESLDHSLHSNHLSSSKSSLNFNASIHLDQYIMHAREALGVDANSTYRNSTEINSETESEADDLLQQHLEELNLKLPGAIMDSNAKLHLNDRNHRINSSTRSVTSLVSQLSGTLRSNGNIFAKSVVSGPAEQKGWSGKPPLRALYDLLIAPVEDGLRLTDPGETGMRDLILVLEGDLHMVPFVLLKGASTPPLHERFTLRIVPSIKVLTSNLYVENRPPSSSGMSPALVVGNPSLPASVTKKWKWGDLPNAEREAREVAELLGVQALTGTDANKDAVLRAISTAECIHISAAVSWKLSAIVLSPGDMSDMNSPKPDHIEMHDNMERLDLNDSDESDLDRTSSNLPSLSQFLLTAADIADLHLAAKLVIISAYSSEGRSGRVTSDGVLAISRAFLAAGAQSVLVPIWPVSDIANATLMRGMYESLLKGTRVSGALSEGMREVQVAPKFGHPSHWAGFVLVGCDVRLNNKSAMFGNALGDMMTTPSKCREAMRVVLHLIEKSLQRINRGQANPMYTTQQSIMNKVGPVRGWQELLKSVGFRFEEDPTGSIPPSVFFPISDPGDQLLRASSSLQALLGLPGNTILAISKLLSAPEAAQEIIEMLKDLLSCVDMMRKSAENRSSDSSCFIPSRVQSPGTIHSQMLQHVMSKYNREENSAIQLPVNVNLWRTPGCHELLASLGFDLIDVGKEEVHLVTSKQVSRRMIHYTLTGLTAIFDPTETPKALPLEHFSSMESLCSSQSGTSFSGMSLSAMSASSIISSHSLKSGTGHSLKSGSGHHSLENKISRSVVKSVKEGRRNLSNRNNSTSTPVKSQEKTKLQVSFPEQLEAPPQSKSPDMSPVPYNTTPTKPARPTDLPGLNDIEFTEDFDNTLIQSSLAQARAYPEVPRFQLGARPIHSRAVQSPHVYESPMNSSKENLMSELANSVSQGVLNPGFLEESDYSGYPSNISSASSLELTTTDLKNLVFRGRTDSNRSSASSEVFLPQSPKKESDKNVRISPVTSGSPVTRGSSVTRSSPRSSPGMIKQNRISPQVPGSPGKLSQCSSLQSSRQNSLDGHGRLIPVSMDNGQLSHSSQSFSTESSGKESPHELIAMKVLQDTMAHMNAVQHMQKATRRKPLKRSEEINSSNRNPMRALPDVNYSSSTPTNEDMDLPPSQTEDSEGVPNMNNINSQHLDERNYPDLITDKKIPPAIKAKPSKEFINAKLQNKQCGKEYGNGENIELNLFPQDGRVSIHMNANLTPSSENNFTNLNGEHKIFSNNNHQPENRSTNANHNRLSSSESVSSSSNSLTSQSRPPPPLKPLPSYHQAMSRRSSTSSQRSDGSDNMLVGKAPPPPAYAGRPLSAQSTNSSMCSSTSSLPSVIHVSNAGRNSQSLSANVHGGKINPPVMGNSTLSQQVQHSNGNAWYSSPNSSFDSSREDGGVKVNGVPPGTKPGMVVRGSSLPEHNSVRFQRNPSLSSTASSSSDPNTPRNVPNGGVGTHLKLGTHSTPQFVHTTEGARKSFGQKIYHSSEC